ncbi:MAG: hypothetical protein U0M42_01270 [Acutalibacteraceae bacterium]|nr:hypothetical protein [Acutalibacteraceae bacterium]
MKKLLALLLAFCMIFVLVACGGTDGNDSSNPSSKPSIVTGVDDEGDELDNSSEAESLVLDGTDQYVVCIKKGNETMKEKIKSIKDIKGLSVGAAYDGDGEKMAKYYGATHVGYGGENDAFSELVGGTLLDCVIVKKGAGEQYQDRGTAEIILDPIVIE